MSSLFDNAGEANLRACAQMVEDVLKKRGLDPATSRTQTNAGSAWRLRQGSAEVVISLASHASGNTFQVIAPVMRPATQGDAKLLRHLLELNATKLTQAAFGVRDEDVVLTADRSTAGLDLVEVEEMIRRVADYADHYDDALVAEFGGVRHSDL